MKIKKTSCLRILELNKFGNRFYIILKGQIIKHLILLVTLFRVKPFKNVKRTYLSNPQATMLTTIKKTKQARLTMKEVREVNRMQNKLIKMMTTLLMLKNTLKKKMTKILLEILMKMLKILMRRN